MPLIECPDCHAQISDAAPACPRCGRPAVAPPPMAFAPPPAQPERMAERVIFEDPTVRVTTVRAVFLGAQTYAMSNVTSVSAFVEPRPPVLIVLAVCFVVMGGSCISMNIADSAQVGRWELALALVLVVIYAAKKPRHWVRIATAGAEQNAIWSHDPRWTQTVVAAINEAIVARG